MPMSRTLLSIISFRSFRADTGEWVRFIKGVFVFGIVPFLLVWGPTKFFAWEMGETVPFKEVAQRQVQNSAILFMPYREVNVVRFKLIRVAQDRPEIISVGQSRGKQLRAAMFAPCSFYNLGSGGWSWFSQLEVVRRLVEEHKPRVLILNIDFFAFNSAFTAVCFNFKPQFESKPWTDELNAMHDSFFEWTSHPQYLLVPPRDHIYGQPTIGFRAADESWGIRLDGSETLPPGQINNAGIDHVTFDEVRHSKMRPLFPGDKMDAPEMEAFEELVRVAHANGVTVVGYQAPIYSPILRDIEQSSDYGILKDFESHKDNGYFEKQGVIFFDFLEFPPYSANPAYFIDPFHPTEVLDAALVLKMAEDPRIKALLPNLGTAALQQKLNEERQASQHVFLFPK